MTSFHKVFQNRSQITEAKLPGNPGPTWIEKIEYLIFTQCVPKVSQMSEILIIAARTR